MAISMTGSGEVHLVEQDRRLVRVAQGVAGAGILQAGQGDDVAGVGFLDVLAVVGVHQQHAADTFLLVARGIEQAHAAFQLTGIDPAEGQRADERVVHDLEREHGQRLVVRRAAGHRLFGLVVEARRRRNVDRRGQIFDDGVEQRLDAFVLERRPAQHRIEGAGQHRLADALVQHIGARLVAVEVGFHRVVVEFDGILDHEVTRFLGGGLQIGGDLLVMIVGAQAFAFPDDRLHADEVDDALERRFRPDRQLDRHGLDAQAVADRLDAGFEVGADLVHLVHEDEARHVVAVGLTPDRFGLRLNALVPVEHGDAAVEHAQRTLDLDGEVHVAGGVDDVEALAVPHRGGGGGGDRDPPLLFLLHPVHGRGAVVDFADLMALAGVVQNPFRGRGLPGVDVRHDAEITVVFDVGRAGHGGLS